MAFNRRMRWSVIGSLGIHAIFFLLAFLLVMRAQESEAPPQPVVLQLHPQPQTPEKHFAESAIPAADPPAPTDAIAEHHSKAMDAVATPNQDAGPLLKDKEADLLPSAPPASLAAATEPPSPQVQSVEETPAVEAPDPEPIQTASVTKAEPGAPPADKEKQGARPIQKDPPEAASIDSMKENSLQVAQASPSAPPSAPSEEAPSSGAPHPGSSRASGVDSIGETNFTAIEDKMAPYLKSIRKRVEQRWLTALLTRYSGMSPTEAEIYCEIAPDGRLVAATINGQPMDRIFAAICRRAIQEAGPFGPFTFEVPDIYRNKNLEIRWSFRFM